VARVKVLVSDSQLMFAHALGIALSRCPQLEIVPELPTSGSDVIGSALAHRPRVILLDHWIEGMDSTAVTEAILEHVPNAKVLHLSWFHGPEHIQVALRAGAVGFLPKGLTVDSVEDAIHRADAGENPVFEEELDRLVMRIERRKNLLENENRRLRSLTPRELEILRYMSTGLTVEKIASRLDIKATTVRRHVHHILQKSGAATQLEAVAIARDHGLVQ
jgi:DNA-binding NarL/FixJ family response regulator